MALFTKEKKSMPSLDFGGREGKVLLLVTVVAITGHKYTKETPGSDLETDSKCVPS